MGGLLLFFMLLSWPAEPPVLFDQADVRALCDISRSSKTQARGGSSLVFAGLIFGLSKRTFGIVDFPGLANPSFFQKAEEAQNITDQPNGVLLEP